MTEIIDVIKYICINYPFSHELSNARLTKIIYLSDWESKKTNGSQITKIKWYFDSYGPYVNDVLDCAKNSDEINVEETKNYYGTPKTLISIRAGSDFPSLSDSEKLIIDKVIDITKSMFWKEFINYVYSTEPIKNNQRYTFLDL